MAEIIGAVASIATIAGLAKPAARLLRTMRKLAKDSDHVAKEIENMAAQVEMTSASLDIALQQLRGHCSTIRHIRDTRSEVLDYIVKNNLTDCIVRGSQGIKRHMEAVRSQLSSLDGGWRLIKGLKWYMWVKMEVQSLLPQFELVKTSLSLICPIINLEIMVHHSQTLGDRAARQFKPEIKSLKRQLRMSEQNYQKMMTSEALCDNFHAGFHRSFERCLAPLLRLSETMRTSEAVPETSSSSTRTHMNIPSWPRSGSPVSESTSLKSQTSLESRASQSSYGSVAPPQPWTPSRPTTPSIPSTPSVHSSSSSVSTPPRSPAPSNTSKLEGLCKACKFLNLQAAHVPGKSDKAKNPMEQGKPATSSTLGQLQSQVKLPPFPKLKVGQLPFQYITQGRLKSLPGGHVSKPLLALVDASVPYNIISIKAARGLNLDMAELDSEDKESLSHHVARRIMGKIPDIAWQSDRWTRPVELEFLVEDTHQSGGYDILLGNEYLDLKSRQNP